MTKNKTTTAIAMFLMLTFTISLVALPAATAQVPYVSVGKRETYPFIGAVPNPVGVGQEVLIHVGITHALAGVQYGWEGLTVTVTRPDGTTETLGPIKTDSTGGTGRVYVPTMAGNYTLQTNFPEQRMPITSTGTPVNTTMLASNSVKLTLVVNQEPIAIYPGVPLPTEYWTRPIDSQFREWYTDAGSWLTTPNNVITSGNDDAPETAHVLWTKPFTTGGLVGGDEYGLLGSGGTSVAFETGDAYQGKWTSRLIIAGVLIYTHHTSVRPLVYTAVNLRTGKVLWEKTFLDNRTISMGQLFYWQTYNYQGTYAYLWVTVSNDWYAFDPFDGNLRVTIYNMTTGTNIIGSKGEIYRYSINQNTGRMLLWNLSALISMDGSYLGPGPSTYNASATLANGTLTAATQRAYALNFTFPTGLPGSVRTVILGDRVIGALINSTDVVSWAFSLKPGQEGQMLFNYDWKAPAEWLAGNQSIGWNAVSSQSKDGFFALWSNEKMQYYGFSTETGEFLWKTASENYLNFYGLVSERPPYIAYGKLYSTGVSGIVYCYDGKTGKTLWTYDAVDPYTEFLFNNNWWLRILFFADGKIYLGHSEHSGNQPLPRGAPFVCLNATTGELIWRVNGLLRQTHWGGRAIIGDSIIAGMDTYSQQVFALGKGPSATTVTAPDIAASFGTPIVIKGTVTDVSPGTEEYDLTARFPNGVPAVSDNSMSDWMVYVYKQFPRPTNATGVEVTLSVLDSNGNFREIGKATSDSDGFYSLQWIPDVSGKYTVYASFAGSKSYYPSHAETAFAVAEAPEPTAPPVEQPPSMTDTYVMYAAVAIIVAVAIVGALIMLMFRKRS